MFVLMSEPALKCENNLPSFKQIYATQKLFIAFKMAYSGAVSGNLDFLEFLQKKVLSHQLQDQKVIFCLCHWVNPKPFRKQHPSMRLQNQLNRFDWKLFTPVAGRQNNVKVSKR